MTTRGRFITLEGGEGVGKSTLAANLAWKLDERGIRVVRTREPGGSPGAEALRHLILAPPHLQVMGNQSGVRGWPAIAETLLFYAARSDHLDGTIRPALDRGDWVICDRFSDSTRAYQVAAGGVATEHFDALESMVVGAHSPELTFVLDLPMNIARTRMKHRGIDEDAIEARHASYHDAVHRAFLAIAHNNPQRCVVLDASAAPEALAETAMAEITRRFVEVR